MKRMASVVMAVILVAVSSAGSANAEPNEFREKCRTTAFRHDHPTLCAPYYGGGGTLPGGKGGNGGRGILGGLLGGLTGGLL